MSHIGISGLRGYGIAIGSCCAALAIAIILTRAEIHDVAFPLFLMAIAITVWLVERGPAILGMFLCIFSFNYFFTDPLYSLYVSRKELPSYGIFILFAVLLAWFTRIRRNAERELLRSHEALQNDISERKRREEQIRTLNEQLEKRTGELEAINKELEAFAYTISHDLRAPLRHMVGFTELLQKHARENLDDKGRRYIAITLEAAKRMGQLVDDLLAFSRIGRIDTHKTTVSLQQLVAEARIEVEPEVRERDVIWKIGELPACFGDRSMLRLAFVNLVSNALKFTRTRARAEIEIDCLERSASQVVLFVRDNGVGFDMQYQNKLFGVFQRLHSQDEFEGTGIGLATVRRIIHRHGGKVWAEAAPDRGATFYLSLSASSGVSS
jgi:signal transduction histidine kinase